MSLLTRLTLLILLISAMIVWLAMGIRYPMGKWDVVALELYPVPHMYPQLYLYDTRHGVKIAAAKNLIGSASPSWSPDGQKLAFAGLANDRYDIYTLDLATWTITRLTSRSINNHSPLWQANGEIQYISDTLTYVMNNDGSNSHRYSMSTIYDETTLSPDRTKMVQRHRDGLSLLDLTNKAAVPIIRTGCIDYQFSWSPGGRYLLVLYCQKVYIYTVETGTLADVTPPQLNFPFTHFEWSPDERELAFEVLDNNQHGSIVIIDVETWEIKPLVDITYFSRFDFRN